MKTYFGNYLGLVIDDRDPQQRGRVKVFIPHVMPALYEGWNDAGSDISFNITDGGLPTGLSLEIVERLQKILPWAECASPVFGAGPAGVYDYSNGTLNAPVHNRVSGAGFDTASEVGGSGMPSRAEAITGTGAFGGGDLQLDRSNEYTGTTRPLGTVDKIVLHDTSGYSLPESGVYNYVVKDGTIYSQVPEGQAATYGVYKHNSSTINISWVGREGETPSAADQTALARIIGYSASKYGLNSSQIETHYWADVNDRAAGGVGYAKSGKDPREASWKDIVLPQVRASAFTGTGATNPSEDPFLNADANAWADLDNERGVIDDEGYNEAPLIGENEELPNAVTGEIDTPAESTSSTVRFGATAYGNADIDETTASEIQSGKLKWEYQFLGSTGNKLVPGVSIASNVLPPNTFVKLTDSNGNPITNSNNPTGVYRVDDTGGPAVDTNIDFYAGSDQALYNELAVIAGGKNSNNISVTAANPEDIQAVNSALEAAATTARQPIIRNPSPYGSVGGPNTNYMPTGMFGGARAGQMVWVFFQEGDPLFPVYFAASYGATEWANIMESNSPAKKNPKDSLQSTEQKISLDGGGIASRQIIGGQSGTDKDEFSLELFGKNGSNLNFTFLATLLNSKYDFRQHTQGDAHYITGGNREDRTTGDHNVVCEQDLIFTVGNWGQEALDAAFEIQEAINEAMKAAKDTYEAS